MYFEVCSNSAYPQHFGERYRTNCPLVFSIIVTIILLYGEKLISHLSSTFVTNGVKVNT